MTDIIDRLRSIDCSWSDEGEIAAAAADEIERLRAEVSDLQAEMDDEIQSAKVHIDAYLEANEQLRDELSALKNQKPLAWISTNRISGERVLGTFRVTSEYDTTLYSHTALVPKPEDV